MSRTPPFLFLWPPRACDSWLFWFSVSPDSTPPSRSSCCPLCPRVCSLSVCGDTLFRGSCPGALAHLHGGPGDSWLGGVKTCWQARYAHCPHDSSCSHRAKGSRDDFTRVLHGSGTSPSGTYTQWNLLGHKKNEMMPFAATWMQLEPLILNEVRKVNTVSVIRGV